MDKDDIPESDRKPCGSCGEVGVWVVTDTRRRPMLVNLEPAPNGNIKLTKTSTGALSAHVVAAKLAFGKNDLHLSHFATCPHAEQHRRKAANRRRGTTRGKRT